MPQVDAVGQLAEVDQWARAQHFGHRPARHQHGDQHQGGGQFHHRHAPDHGVHVVPGLLHEQRHGQHQPHEVRQARAQFLEPARLLQHQRGQQRAGQQARGARVEAKEDLVELLPLRHPQHAPRPAQHHQRRDDAPQLAAGRAVHQHRQQRRPDQVEALFHRQRPHVQQRVGLVEEGDAVVGQVQRRHQRVAVHALDARPQQRRQQAVGGQKEQQRGHQPVEAAAVKAPVLDAAGAAQLQQQQRGDQVAAEHEEQVNPVERPLKQRRVRVRQDHQHDGHAAQAVQRGVVRQRAGRRRWVGGKRRHLLAGRREACLRQNGKYLLRGPRPVPPHAAAASLSQRKPWCRAPVGGLIAPRRCACEWARQTDVARPQTPQKHAQRAPLPRRAPWQTPAPERSSRAGAHRQARRPKILVSACYHPVAKCVQA